MIGLPFPSHKISLYWSLHSPFREFRHRWRIVGVFVAFLLTGTLFGQGLPVNAPGTEEDTGSDVLAVLTEQDHPWGRFPQHSWIHTQTISWSAQDGQRFGERIASVRETKTTLESIDTDGVTLKKEVMLTMGGKQVKTAPQVERFDFYREPIETGVIARNIGTGKLLVNNLVIPCKKRVYEKQSATEKRTTTLWFTTQLYPYVLRSETVLRALPLEQSPLERELRRSITEVYESSSFHLRGNQDGSYRYRTKTTESNMTTIVDASCSRYIPGGVVQALVREYDATGAEIRSSETRIINYSMASPSDTLLNPPLDTPPNTPHTLIPGASPYPLAPMPLRPRWRRFYPLPAPLSAPLSTPQPYVPPPAHPGEPTLAPPQGN